MKKSIIITKPLKEELYNHLLQNLNQENMAVTLCGLNSYGTNFQLLVKNVLLINDNDLLIHSATGLELKENPYRKILLKCDETKTSPLFWHSHPFSTNAWFSSIDNTNDLINGKFISEHLPQAHYGNVVLSQKDYKARLFNKEKHNFEEIQEIKILGETQHLNDTKFEPELDRNHRAFGEMGQSVISQLKILLVGCGGLGWIIAQELIGIGVRDLLLIDYDTIEITNLNRLPGAPFMSVGLPKVKVLADLLKRMNPKVNIKSLIARISENKVKKELKKCDVIIGAVDNDGARAYLNEFSAKYLKIYLDGGSGILLENGKVKHAGGQVTVVMPGSSPCLACNNTLDWKVILYESMSKKEQDMEVKQGYIQDISEPSPSVVSINGVTASALVNEFLALTTGLKEPNYYTYYDFMNKDKLMFPVEVKKNDNCIICSNEALFGYGDVAEENKKSTGLPSFIIEESCNEIDIDTFSKYKKIKSGFNKKSFTRPKIRKRFWYKEYI